MIKLTLFTILCLFSTLSNSATMQGRVVKIVDGDTVHLLLADNKIEKIRLAGIDTPEIRPSQPFAKAAKRYLADMVGAKDVVIEWSKRDRYQRIVGKIIKGDVDICLELVRAGLAWHYKKYQNEQAPADRNLYSKAEEVAKDNKIGLWSDPTSIPPWEFRKLGR